MESISNWTKQHPLKMTVCFAIIYFSWFMLLERFRKPILYIHTNLDNYVPFCKYMIVPYIAWFFYIFLTFAWLYKHDIDEYLYMAKYMFIGMIVCLAIYTIIPTGLTIRETVSGNDICAILVRMIQKTDTPTNVCPSIHVFNSVCAAIVLGRNKYLKSKRTGVMIYVLTIVICLSTVMLKQHSVLDVFWACVLNIMLYPLCLKKEYEYYAEAEKVKY